MYDNRITTITDYSKNKAKSKVSALNKFFIGFIIFVFASFFVLLFFQLILTSQFPIKNINYSVNGQKADITKNIIDVGNFNSISNFFGIDCLAIEGSLASISYVKKVEVSKKFPDSINISVITREPVASFIDDTNNIFVFDKNACYFKHTDIGSSLDFPIISGEFYSLLKADAITKNLAIDVLIQLDKIKSENYNLYRLISEIKFDKKGAGDFELLIFLKGYNIPLRFTAILDNELLLISLGVLDALKLVDVDNILEIDYRAQKPVYVCGG